MGPPGGPGTYVENYALLRLLDPSAFVAGYVSNVAGYATANDGGGGQFSYDPSSSEADNNGTVIEPANSIGRWLRVFSGAYNVRWFGAKGDGIANDTTAIQNAADTAATGNAETTIRGIEIFAPAGVYLVNQIDLSRGTTVTGEGPDLTIFRKVGTTDFAFNFDSTGVPATGVQDRIQIQQLAIWQVGAPSDGGGININGVTSDARATIINVQIQNCYRGVVLNKTIHSYLRGVIVLFAIKEGFRLATYHYVLNAIDCFASGCGDNGWYLQDGNYCNIIGCAADGNALAGYHFFNTHFSALVNSGNERNKYGSYLQQCDGVVIDTFYTLVGIDTLNAVVLDATQRCELRNICSSHQNAAYGTYMVSSIGGSVFNKLSTGYQSQKWNGASNSGVIDDISSLMELHQLLEGAQAAKLDLRYPTVNLTTGITNLRGVTFNGGIIPPIDMQTSLVNEKRIIATYSSGNTFAGLGMGATDLAVRIAGNPGGTGIVTDMGYYSEDGAYTWASRLKVSGQGVLFLKNSTQFLDGVGSPEGVISAPPGSLFLNNLGGASVEAYLKESGSGNTGWKAVITA